MSERDPFLDLPPGYIAIPEKDFNRQHAVIYDMIHWELQSKIEKDLKKKYVKWLVILPILSAVVGFFIGRIV